MDAAATLRQTRATPSVTQQQTGCGPLTVGAGEPTNGGDEPTNGDGDGAGDGGGRSLLLAIAIIGAIGAAVLGGGGV